MGKNADLVIRTLKELESRHYEVVSTNIAEQLQIMFRVPAALRRPGQSVTDVATTAVREFEQKGWTLSSFIADRDSVVISITRPAVPE